MRYAKLVSTLFVSAAFAAQANDGVELSMKTKAAASIVTSKQQKSAADKIDAAIRHIRDEHGALTVTMTGQRMRIIERIEALAAEMDVDRSAR